MIVGIVRSWIRFRSGAMRRQGRATDAPDRGNGDHNTRKMAAIVFCGRMAHALSICALDRGKAAHLSCTVTTRRSHRQKSVQRHQPDTVHRRTAFETRLDTHPRRIQDHVVVQATPGRVGAHRRRRHRRRRLSRARALGRDHVGRGRRDRRRRARAQPARGSRARQEGGARQPGRRHRRDLDQLRDQRARRRLHDPVRRGEPAAPPGAATRRLRLREVHAGVDPRPRRRGGRGEGRLAHTTR